MRELLLLSLLVAALATLSGFLISRRLTRPVQALTASAARIGRGDLSTPTPRAPGAELGTLAATMEEMRRRLLQLTSELRRRQAEGEAILTGIVEGVFSVDRDRRVRYLNPQAAALLGVAPERRARPLLRRRAEPARTRTARAPARRAARSSTPASAAAPPPPSTSCGRTAAAWPW